MNSNLVGSHYLSRVFELGESGAGVGPTHPCSTHSVLSVVESQRETCMQLAIQPSRSRCNAALAIQPRATDPHSDSRKPQGNQIS